MNDIAVLGLGHIGAPLARRLVEAGHRVTVWNRTAGRTVDGADTAAAPADAAAKADIVITMLTDGPAVHAVVEAARLRAGTTLVDMSTIGPDALRDLVARLPAGVELVDAPVAGSVAAAEAGTLRILAGGRPEAVDRVAPVLADLGDVRRCGGPGTGAALKLVLNTALVTAVAALTDVLAVADAVGVDRDAALDALRAGPLGIVVQRAAEGGGRFAITLAAKDLALALDATEHAPVATGAGAHLRRAVDQGHGADDLFALVKG